MINEVGSQFEDFPDEIILLICRYLNQYEILNSFSCLNNRLSKTINEFSEKIDLNSIPLKLINRFENEIFENVKLNIRSFIFGENIQRIRIDYENFPNIESINFVNKYSEEFPIHIKEIQIDLVPVELQKDLLEKFFLSNKYLNLESLSIHSFHGLTFSNLHLNNLIPLKSLKISLKNNSDLFEVLHLFSSTIEYLNILIIYNGLFKSSSTFKLTKLRSFHLKTTYEDSIQFKQLEDLILQSLSSIEHLSIETLTRDQNYIDGFKWQNLLNKLIYLKTFHFAIRYRFKLNDDPYHQQFIEEQLFQSFSTDFWINQKQWFIQYYSTNSNKYRNSFKITNYAKLFLHTIPYPFRFIDATIDINMAKSTYEQYTTRNVYSNVRHLYYDGENLPIKYEDFKEILQKFQWISELKLERLIVDSSTNFSDENRINLKHLNKLIIYKSDEKPSFNIDFLNFSSINNLRYISVPEILIEDYSKLPKQLESLILIDCHRLNFDFVHRYENLRVLKLYLNHFDRLLETNGYLILNLIQSIYKTNQILELLHLMCHGINQIKVKTFQQQFNQNNFDCLNAIYDGKCLTIQRTQQFFNPNI